MAAERVSHHRLRVDSSGLLAAGLYDTVVDERLKRLLERARSAGLEVESRSLKGHDAPLVSREVAEAIERALAVRLGDDAIATEAEIRLLNRLLAVLREVETGAESEFPNVLPEVLKRVGPSPSNQPADLSDHGLLTGREGTESLRHQLARELASSDRVDWLVSFVKRSAVLMMRGEIEGFLARGGTMRIVTTPYLGATDPAALELLARISREHGRRLHIRFSRESGATRLHAKAYLHHRESGFGSAYIGSANFSRPALTEGLEWTVRLSQAASPGLWTKIQETFDQWWGDPDFVEYGLDEDHPSHAKFRELVAREKGRGTPGSDPDSGILPIFDLEPKPFQQAILDRIEVERKELGFRRHLVVAATGTGKTMIAAFDFRRFSSEFRTAHGRNPRLLYLAHTERILRQARLTFGQVLRDLNFGGLLVAGMDDRPCDALFASIQSWRSRRCQDSFSPDHFDWAVVDEVHHGEAPTWASVLEWINPTSLLGLTATPERTDGLDITRHFGGRLTAEMRLAEAIRRRLLVPFHYFGITDSIDLRGIACSRRTGYSNSMDLVERAYLDAGRQWIDSVWRAIDGHVALKSMRAIGFCSGVAHAKAMREAFENNRVQASRHGKSGIRAESLDGSDSLERRDEVIGQLRRGEIQIVFVADLLNEGIDIPEVDTVLFMRPTQSRTVFVQQLGRGLRLCATTDKQALTVLDFVGQYRAEFRLADRYQDLLADNTVPVATQVRDGFVGLPPGCSVTLEKIARERVLHAAQGTGVGAAVRLLELAQETRDRLNRIPSQAEVVQAGGLDPRAFYAHSAGSTWTGIRERLSVTAEAQSESLRPFLAPLKALAALDDPALAKHGLEVLARIENGMRLGTAEIEDRRTQMLLVEFSDPVRASLGLDQPPDAAAVLQVLAANPVLRRECVSILETARVSPPGPRMDSSIPIPPEVPLRLHSRYVRGQIVAAFGWPAAWSTEHQSGVLPIDQHAAYLMFVTLDKNHESFTDRTRYRDYAVSATEFHWQSQASATPDSRDGRRIADAMQGRGAMWLFLRKASKDSLGTEPFHFMGAFRPKEIRGSQPMSITGELATPLPPAWLDIASRAR